MRKFLLATALMLPFAAGATDVRSTNTNTNLSSSHSAALAAATARATAGAIAQGGNASARGGSASANGSVTTTVVGDRDRLQAPALGGLMAAASGPCVGASYTAQGVLAGFGFGGGASTIEEECQIREAARILNALGEKEVATLLILSLPSVKAALGAAAPVTAPAPRVTSTTPPAQTASTPASFKFN